MEKMKKKISSASHLPEEIEFDILIRLPVKSICRFKCVSKSWLSTISSSIFVHSHFHRSRSRPKLLISIWREDSEDFSDPKEYCQSLFIADREDTEQEKKGPLVLRHQATLRLKGVPLKYSLTVAGLMLSIDSRDQIVITNPITKASVAFPQAFPEQCGYYRSVCFGFDSRDGKHKIVESQAYIPKFTSVERMEHSVVSLSDSGNRRSVQGPSVGFYFREQEVCVDGVIYYAACAKPARQEPWIVAFDLRSEKFQVAELSIKGRLSDTRNPYKYIEFEGKLAIVDYPYSNKVGDAGVKVPALDLWVMEDFENQVWNFKSYCLPPSFARTRMLIGTMDGELIFVEFGNKDKPFLLRGYSYFYGKFIKLPEKDVPFYFYFLNIKTGILQSREVRLPPGFHLTRKVAIRAASFVERL